MRELKFRSWSEETLSFEYFDLYRGTECGLTNLQIWTRNSPIEQYTGLKDKNGKEIYEGDIVSYRGNNYQIKWSEVSFAYIASSNNQYYWLSPSKSDVFEVIGNIHENPELLIKEVELSEEDKAIAEKAAKLIIRDYGEVLKKLGDE